MQRLTISVNAHMAGSFDQLIERKGYRNRSEAFRDLVRKALREEHITNGSAASCVACVSFVYSYRQQQLAARLIALRQRNGHVTVSATHTPIDDDNCMETLILRGETTAVIKLADAIVAETGVRHGHLNLVPVDVAAEPTGGKSSGRRNPT